MASYEELAQAELANQIPEPGMGPPPGPLRLTVRPAGFAAPTNDLAEGRPWGAPDADTGRPGRLFEPDLEPAIPTPPPEVVPRAELGGFRPSWIGAGKAIGSGLGSLVQGARDMFAAPAPAAVQPQAPRDPTAGPRQMWQQGYPSDPKPTMLQSSLQDVLGAPHTMIEAGRTINDPAATEQQVQQARQAEAGAAFDITSNLAGVGTAFAAARPGASAGIFGGSLSKSADLPKRQLAEVMEGNGLPPNRIWRETGWMRGADNKWMNEISDLDAFYTGKSFQTQLKMQQGQQLYLPDVIYHPELFKAYPELRKMPVSKDMTMWGQGSYTARGPNSPASIAFREEEKSARGETFKVLLHEIQHGIQQIENFARGTNPNATFRPGDPGYKIYERMKNQGPVVLNWQQYRDLYATKGVQKTPDEYLAYRQSAQKSQIEYEKQSMRAAGQENYNRSAGENPANVVMGRTEYTPQQAAAIFPGSEMRVPMHRQTVEFNTLFGPSQAQTGKGLRNTWAAKMLDDPEYGKLPHITERYKPTEYEWYHGTQAPEFNEFRFGGVKRQTADWNTMLGPHFSDSHGVADMFAGGHYTGRKEGGRVLKVQLNIEKPKIYKSETDLSDDAVRWAANNKLITPEDFKRGGGDTRGIGQEFAKAGAVPDWAYGFGGEVLRGAGNRRKRIADGFRKSLAEAGHDGIVYGNNVEGVATQAAIPFAPHQVQMSPPSSQAQLGGLVKPPEMQASMPLRGKAAEEAWRGTDREPKLRTAVHPFSNVGGTPINEMQSPIIRGGKIINPRTLDIEKDLTNAEFIFTGGDATGAGGKLHGSRDMPFEQPVGRYGGPGYGSIMQGKPIAGHPGASPVWASMKGPMAEILNIAKDVERRGKEPWQVYMTGGKQYLDSSMQMVDTAIQAAKSKGVSTAANEHLVKVMQSDWNKLKPDPRRPFPETGFKDEAALKAWIDASPQPQRAKFVKAMDTKTARELGFPNIGELRVWNTDPRMITAPPGSAGLTLSRIDPSIGLIPSHHPAYNTAIGGRDVSTLGMQVPHQIIAPTMHESRMSTLKKPQYYEAAPHLYFPGGGTHAAKTEPVTNKLKDILQRWMLDNPGGLAVAGTAGGLGSLVDPSRYEAR